MILSDIETAVRLDLFDPASATQRWSNTDIDRAIDKAVDRYSAVYPNIAFVDMATQSYQRTYPYPTSWNTSYPPLWIERVLYPLQVLGSALAAPASAPSAVLQSGTSLGVGIYQYVVTYITQGGETTAGPGVSVTTTTNNQRVQLSNIPVGPAASGTNYVLGRNVYRTQVGGSSYTLLATLTDNSTTTYNDTVADSSISGKPALVAVNTSGIMCYPPYERNFSEYSNLFSSSLSLAGGGNLGNMGAVGTTASFTGTGEPTFTLDLTASQLPQDATGVIRVFYATKQQLDSSSSTIPEIHRDVIVLGAAAYCMEAYQVPTNDNFNFHDGGLHDSIDDTAIPTAWRAATKARMQAFEVQLERIRQARDYASSARAQWGQVPARWHLL